MLTLLWLAPLAIWGGLRLLPLLAEALTQLSLSPGNAAFTLLFEGGPYSWLPATLLPGMALLALIVWRDKPVWR